MTTYTRDDDQYVPIADFPSWLEEKLLPKEYQDIFSWNNDKLYSEYERLFVIYEEIGLELLALEKRFEKLHAERKNYMQANGFEMWSDLDEIQDAHHLEKKDLFFEEIAALTNTIKQVRNNFYIPCRALKLLAGIWYGFYSSYSRICEDEQDTWGLMSTNNSDPIWNQIGPLQNPFWNISPISKTSSNGY